MRFILGWLKSAGAVCLGLCLGGSASAAVIINVVQSGSDVVLSMSGSLSNLGTPAFTGSTNFSRGAGISITRPPDYEYLNDDEFFLSKGGITTFSSYAPISVPGPSWGIDSGTLSSSFTSSLDYFYFGNNGLATNISYLFGTAITGSATFNNQTLANLGLTNQGSYVYKFGSGANTDTVTFNIGGSGGGGGGGEVPEPSTMAIFGLGAIGMAYRARRKAKA